jgi:hypothetical protein
VFTALRTQAADFGARIDDALILTGFDARAVVRLAVPERTLDARFDEPTIPRLLRIHRRLAFATLRTGFS